jgi:hypothetical protein
MKEKSSGNLRKESERKKQKRNDRVATTIILKNNERQIGSVY